MSDDILKDLVVGYLVVKDYDQVTVKPLAIGWDGEPDDLIHEDTEEIIGVIPAQPGTLQVWGVMPDGEAKPLGYELPGADCPNWEDKLAARIKRWEVERNG